MCRKLRRDGMWFVVGSMVAGLMVLLGVAWVACATQIESDSPDIIFTNSGETLGSQIIASSDMTETVYLPSVLGYYDPSWIEPWGVETNDYTLLDKGTEAGIHWLRLRLKWSDIQPTESSFQWSSYDNVMDQVKASGMKPIVVVCDNPEWADQDGNRCGPLTDTSHLTNFLTELAKRYGSGTGYNVRHWQIGNEVDHDYQTWLDTYYPSGQIGCWGDKIEEYITFLEAARGALKAQDPNAVVMVGSLAMVDSTILDFLDRFLAAGGGSHFDAASVHFYSGQDNAGYTCADPPSCTIKGLKGKVTILRNVMAKYGLDKPLMITEIAGRCFPADQPCSTADLEAQANYAIRYNVEAMSVDATPAIWFTLDYPGFYHSSLLDENDDPKPAYIAYQMLTFELYGGRFVRQMSASEVGSDTEGYVISTAGGTKEKYVLWRTSSGTSIVSFSLSAVKTATRNDMTIETTVIQDGQIGDLDSRTGYVGISVGESPKIVAHYP